MTEHLLGYFGAINLVTLVLSMFDRVCARYGFWRLPETLLLVLAWMGGAIAAKFVQLISGHKSLKVEYSTHLNLIVLFQFSLVLAIWSAQVTSKMQDENVTMLESWMGKEEKAARPKRFGPGSQKK